MFVQSKKWCTHLILLVVTLALAGCQSCQETTPVPPQSQPKAQEPAPPVNVPVVDEADDADDAADEEPLAVDDEIDEDALVLLAEGDPEDGEAPLTVKFTVESLLEDEMDAPQYKWDFGDGTPISTEASPTHVYEKPGSFTATIRIVDAAGQLGWDEVDVEVDDPSDD